MLNTTSMRTALVAMAALGLALGLYSLLTRSQLVTTNTSTANTPSLLTASPCTHGCAHHQPTRPAAHLCTTSNPLWQSSLDQPQSSLTITGTPPAAQNYLPGTRQSITLENNTRLDIKVTRRFTHTDGTIAIDATVAGTPQGQLHMQWNPDHNFFLGQITYAQLPIAYQITRDHHGKHQITHHPVTDLVCSEINTDTGTVRYGLPALPAQLHAEAESVDQVTINTEASSTTPTLNSYPTATACIYLDFDGELVQGTSWGSSINAAATGYSTSKITSIWQRVATDFEPFNINVTTDESVYLSTPSPQRIRCIITPSNEWYGSSTAGGVAKYHSFTWSGDTPCWVFSDNLANGTKYIAEACSHEVGHTLGLSHDGETGTTYYAGHGSGTTSWAPIMGNSYFKNVTQWSKGEYSNATNTQDDLAIITSTNNGFGYRSDDHNNSSNNATPLPADPDNQINGNGTIERANDTDVFSIQCADGPLTLNINPANNNGNLDIQAKLYDASNNLITTSNPSSQLNATITSTVTSGQYFLHIQATGFGTANTGYTNYASLGSYTINGEVTTAPTPTPFELTVANLPENQRSPEHDPDNDGINNLTEHALGSDPANPDSLPQFSRIEPNTSNSIDFLIDLPNNIPTDVTYTIEASCSMAPNDWTSIASLYQETWSGTSSVTEETGPNGTRRFRVTETQQSPWTCRFIRVRFELP